LLERTDFQTDGEPGAEVFDAAGPFDHFGFFPRRLETSERVWLGMPTLDFHCGCRDAAAKDDFRQGVRTDRKRRARNSVICDDP
jgi:hypothetical protein